MVQEIKAQTYCHGGSGRSLLRCVVQVLKLILPILSYFAVADVSHFGQMADSLVDCADILWL